MTDTTLHESLPVEIGTYRQYFRHVTNQVSGWFADHSTPNPLGIKPDCPILYGNKFADQIDVKLTQGQTKETALEMEVKIVVRLPAALDTAYAAAAAYKL